MIEIKQIQRRDYQKAQSFAVEGMHLNWYLDQTWALALQQICLVHGAEPRNKSL